MKCLAQELTYLALKLKLNSKFQFRCSALSKYNFWVQIGERDTHTCGHYDSNGAQVMMKVSSQQAQVLFDMYDLLQRIPGNTVPQRGKCEQETF